MYEVVRLINISITKCMLIIDYIKKRNIGNDDDGTKLFDANFLHRQKLSSPLINVAWGE